MLGIYLACTVVGLGLAVIGALGGGHGHDADAGHDLDHGVSHDTDHGHDGALAGIAGWIPFLSLRFWTYAIGSFGLTGLLMELFVPAGSAIRLGSAIGAGLLVGFLVFGGMKFLRRNESDSSVGIKDMLGKEAIVLVGIRPGQMGKVRFETKGDTIDMMAVTEDDSSVAPGERVIVAAVDGLHARVLPLSSLTAGVPEAPIDRV